MSTWRLYKSILPLFSFQHINKEEFDTSILTIYKRIYERYHQEKNLIPTKNLIELPYEEFVKNPLQMLEKIYTQFGIPSFETAKPAFEKYLKKHEVYERNHYTIDEQTKKKVYQEWKELFKNSATNNETFFPTTPSHSPPKLFISFGSINTIQLKNPLRIP